MAAPVAARALLLGRPLAAGAVAALAVNDHVLKPWSGDLPGTPGLLARTTTGKLSDLAGVLLVALLAGVVVGRRRPALALVATAWTALKLSPAIAEAAAPLLGGAPRTDPWDLLALAALVPAHHALATTDGLPLLPPGALARAGGVAGPVATLAVLLVAVPAVTATSCLDGEPAITHVLARDGLVLARQGDLLSDEEVARVRAQPEIVAPTTTTTSTSAPGLRPADGDDPSELVGAWASSADGGRTWQRIDAPPDVAELLVTPPAAEQCTPSGTCFRVRQGDGPGDHDALLRHRGDGDWEEAFAFTDEDLRRMELREQGCAGGPSAGTSLGPLATSGEAAIVARGSQGVVRVPADGPWSRHAVLDAQPLRTDGPRWLVALEQTPWLAATLGPLGLVVLGAGLRRRWWSPVLGVLLSLGGAALLGVAWILLLWWAVDYTIRGPVLAAGTVLVLALSVLATVGTSRRREPG